MQTYRLKLTRAMVVEGNVVRAGTEVTLDEATAKDFLRRGKAELVAVIDQTEAADADQADETPDLSRLNKSQLLELAGQLGVEADDSMTKAQIIAAIEGAE